MPATLSRRIREGPKHEAPISVRATLLHSIPKSIPTFQWDYQFGLKISSCPLYCLGFISLHTKELYKMEFVLTLGLNQRDEFVHIAHHPHIFATPAVRIDARLFSSNQHWVGNPSHFLQVGRITRVEPTLWHEYHKSHRVLTQAAFFLKMRIIWAG